MTLILIAACLSAAAVLLLVSVSDRSDRAATLSLLPAIFSLLLLAETVVLGMVRFDWNAARLMPTFAFAYGYPLYSSELDGPILSSVYGPVSAFAFLPATLFRTPTLAILAAGALEILYVLGPLLGFVHYTAGRGARTRPFTFACSIGACLLLARYPGTSYWIWAISPDGPALGLGLLACWALVSPQGVPITSRNLLLSAVATVLACWTKQIDAPLAVALFGFAWFAYGRAKAISYGISLAVGGALVGALFLAWFGWPMVFNMFVMLVRQPWDQPGIAGLAGKLWALTFSLRHLLVLMVIPFAGALHVRGTQPARVRPWMAPLLVAIILLPTGALGANKFGGDYNSFHSVYYLIAAVAVAMVEWARAMRVGQWFCYGFCVLAVVVAWRSERIALWANQPPVLENDAQQAYEFALRHPGEAYFPWQPLSSLLAEGQVYHFEYALIDRSAGGFPPMDAHVRAYLPPRMRWLVTKGSSLRALAHYFPEYSQVVNLPELPGWTALERRTP